MVKPCYYRIQAASMTGVPLLRPCLYLASPLLLFDQYVLIFEWNAVPHALIEQQHLVVARL
jgi:hypothetical protein